MKQERKAAKEQGTFVPGGTSLSKKNVKPVVETKYAQACHWHKPPLDGCKTCMKFKEKQLDENEKVEDDPMEIKMDVKGSCFWHSTFQANCKEC